MLFGYDGSPRKIHVLKVWPPGGSTQERRLHHVSAMLSGLVYWREHRGMGNYVKGGSSSCFSLNFFSCFFLEYHSQVLSCG